MKTSMEKADDCFQRRIVGEMLLLSLFSDSNWRELSNK